KTVDTEAKAVSVKNGNSWVTPKDYKEAVANLKAKGYDGPTNLVDITRNAEKAYRTELGKYSVNSGDVRGTSFAKAVDLINGEAAKPGNFNSLSGDAIKGRINSGEQPKYYVRIVDKNYMNGSGGQLSAPSKQNVWMATPEEIAGTKKNVFEVMQRVGFTQEDIQKARADVKAGKPVSDYQLVIVEAEGTKGGKVPNWSTMTDAAKNHPDFSAYKGKSDAFWSKVENFDYDKALRGAKRAGLKPEDYAKTLPKSQQEVFMARRQVQNSFGASELYTGNGMTKRPDGQNGGAGVREFWTNNDPIAGQQRQAFIELNADAKSTKVETVSKPNVITDNPLRLRSEMKTGAIGGAVVSGVTSLPQVFDQARSGDYAGAAKTFVTNIGGGAVIGGLSSGAERIVGRSIENQIAARSTSSLFTGTSGSAARQVAGRLGGAGIVGGVVNGGFAAYDQIGAYKRGEVTGSQAIGTVVGESAVGVGAGLAGAAAGAAIGSIIPVAGTAVGAAVGFVVGVGAGWVADKALRYGGVDKMIAKGVTATIDKGMELVGKAQQLGTQAIQAGKAYVGQKIQQAKQVANAVSNGAKAAYTYVNNKVGQVKQAVTAKVNQVKQYVGQKAAQVKQTLSNGAKAAVQYVSQAKKQVVQTVNRAVNTAKATVNNAVNTVKSTVNNAKQAVSNFASNAVGGLKSVFGW
ncbi:MAG: hypothetical protein MUC29_04415, partial [Pyrinomonadaceae bacterium]|nr:hypothetical protein [Pyrinomonadaceae bacterium]